MVGGGHHWVIISLYYFLGDVAEVQPELSDVICADCRNQLDVLQTHHCSRPLIKENQDVSYSAKCNLNVPLSGRRNNAAPDKTPGVRSHLDKTEREPCKTSRRRRRRRRRRRSVDRTTRLLLGDYVGSQIMWLMRLQ